MVEVSEEVAVVVEIIHQEEVLLVIQMMIEDRVISTEEITILLVLQQIITAIVRHLLLHKEKIVGQVRDETTQETMEIQM